VDALDVEQIDRALERGEAVPEVRAEPEERMWHRTDLNPRGG